MEEHALKPLTDGIILLVGVKASNFDEELRTHPRITMWDSQQEHWTNKDIPTNTRAIFITRWIGHNAFGNVLAQARKRGITIFNQEGTGVIARKVKQLLNIEQPIVKKEKEAMTTETTESTEKLRRGRLNTLIPFIQWEKNNTDNARLLLHKAQELKVPTTLKSLTQFVMKQRKKINYISDKPKKIKTVENEENVSIQMFDNAIKELQEMRKFFVETMKDNKELRKKLDSFKKMLQEVKL